MQNTEKKIFFALKKKMQSNSFVVYVRATIYSSKDTNPANWKLHENCVLKIGRTFSEDSNPHK